MNVTSFSGDLFRAPREEVKEVRIGFGSLALGALAFLAGYESLAVVLGAFGGAIITTVRLYGRRSREDKKDER